MEVERVQKWVGSAVLITVLFIFGSGLALLGQTMPDRNGSRTGLLVVAVIVGLIAILGARVINQLRLLTPWLVLGAVPAVLGALIGRAIA